MADDAGFALQMIQRNMVVSTDDLNLLPLQAQYLERFNTLLILGQTWRRCVVRKDEPIENEMAIIWIISKVSAISIVLLAFGILSPQSLAIVSAAQENTNLTLTWLAHSHTKPPISLGYL